MAFTLRKAVLRYGTISSEKGCKMPDVPLLSEAQQLYEHYLSQIRSHPMDFADGLLREALKCYAIEAHTAACVMCRVAVEEALKEIYTVLANFGLDSAQPPVDERQLQSLKDWARELQIIDASEFDIISEIQRRGNRSAHGPTADITAQVRRRTAEELAEPIEIWADRETAQDQIRATQDLLRVMKRTKAEVQSGKWSP